MLRRSQINKFAPILGIILLLSGCVKDLLEPEFDPYARPEWLEGKVYTQIKAQPDLSLFAKCLELTGYDTIVDVSGSYTVFAPMDAAINQWLSENQLLSVEDIPIHDLERIVSYHFVQNPWTKDQLRSVDIYGWIDTLDKTNDKPLGYKRITYLEDEDDVFYVERIEHQMHILKEGESDWTRRVINDARKYVPVFYNAFFDLHNLKSSDYEFYFGRPFDGGENIYYANAKIIGDAINAENGFIYFVDELVEPLENAYDMLESGTDKYQFDKYLDLVNEFPSFEYNEEKTNQQPGISQGLQVDSLFDLTYPDLAINIHNENTSASGEVYNLPDNVTTRYHHGLIAPTNEAFDELLKNYIEIPGGWGSIDRTPINIKRIIVNSHMSLNSIYPNDFAGGIYNGENDFIYIDESNIVQKEYASNSTFIGINSAVVPRAFSSVTGPVYLQKGFSTVMNAIEEAEILQALKRQNKDYMLFVESDISLMNDSSLIYNDILDRFYAITQYPSVVKNSVLTNDLRNLLLNHVGIHQPNRNARKEFILNLAGNYIIVNNETGEISGNSPTTIGYNGNIIAPNYPVEINQYTDNGTTYEIDNWFSFSGKSIYTEIQSSFPAFYNLLKRVNLVNEREYRFTFLSSTNLYTVFAPSDAAIQSSGIDTLSNEELKKTLMLHFLPGGIIFTDGNMPSGYYETLQIDEDKSNEYQTIYATMNIETGYDIIRIKDNNGALYLEVNESEQTNKLTGYNILDEEALVYPNVFTNAVVHSIDKVLLYQDIKTN